MYEDKSGPLPQQISLKPDTKILSKECVIIQKSCPPPRSKIILNSNPKILNNSWVEIQNH